MAKRSREGDLPFRVENSGLIDLDALMREADVPPAAGSTDPMTIPATPPEASGERDVVSDTIAVRAAPLEAAPLGPTPPRLTLVKNAPALPSSAAPGTEIQPRRSSFVRFVVPASFATLALLAAIGAWQRRAPSAPTPAAANPPPLVATTTPPTTTVLQPIPVKVAVTAEPALAHAALPPRPNGLKPAGQVIEPPSESALVTSVVLPDAPAIAEADLGGAMRNAVGARDEAAAREASNEGSAARQVRPAPGAVVGAIQAALPEARACLGPDDPIRRGEIVFRSEGSVARVDLEGARAVDGCVRTALSKARVAPFLADSFATRVTVRP